MPDPAIDFAGHHEIHRITDPESIDSAADKIITARVLTTIANDARKDKRLSKLAEAVAAIKDKKIAHDAKGQEWMDRLAKVGEREADAFAIGDAVIDEREADLREMEQTMRELSNLPNVVSGKS
jgi:hypothetical protein